MDTCAPNVFVGAVASYVEYKSHCSAGNSVGGKAVKRSLICCKTNIIIQNSLYFKLNCLMN